MPDHQSHTQRAAPVTAAARPAWTLPHLRVQAAAPAWFDRVIARPLDSNFVDVEGCPIHYLLWEQDEGRADAPGLLFVHGGGAHANWWRFIAPFFTHQFRVAALDLSGMGDSGARAEYPAALRALEMRAVMQHAEFAPRPFIVGHSFGGFMAMCFGALHGHEAGGLVIADTPIYPPGPDGHRHAPSRPASVARYYPDVETGVSRFRLMPDQPCENAFLVEFIARHSLLETPLGWTWKFDLGAMNARRWEDPFHEYLAATSCRKALIHGELSALVNRETADYMRQFLGPAAPVVEIPAAHHHLMLDQPLAFIAALRAVLASWSDPERPASA